MKTFTVQCCFAAYDGNTVVVEAETLNEALEKAIAEANARSDWESLDVSAETFIDAVAEGDDVDLWSDDTRQLTIPARFTEKGEGPRVIVLVSGGIVQNVAIDGGYARVEVRDYDNGKDDPEAKIDAEGRRYALSDWSNVIPPPQGGG
jgi:hypothetical protein